MVCQNARSIMFWALERVNHRVFIMFIYKAKIGEIQDFRHRESIVQDGYFMIFS